jgi:hypothetical protein
MNEGGRAEIATTKNPARRSRNQERKYNLTTKDTKITKFKIKEIRTLRAFRIAMLKSLRSFRKFFRRSALFGPRSFVPYPRAKTPSLQSLIRFSLAPFAPLRVKSSFVTFVPSW